MSSIKKKSHSLLICKICMKHQEKLSVHLRRVCMKRATDPEITEAVIEARQNKHKLLASLSIVSYQDLNFRKSRFSDPQEFFADFLKSRGCIIPDQPSTRQPSMEEAQSEGEVSEVAMTSSPLRKKLFQAGFHNKYDIDLPVLISFKQYLEKNFSELCIRQMVENVSRYLYFMNPDGISLEFMNDLENTKRFVSTLLSLKTSRCTVKKYLKHSQHFVRFAISEDFPNDIGDDRKQAADNFLASLIEINKEMIPKDEKDKKKQFLRPKDSRKVLISEKATMDGIFAKAELGEELNTEEKMLACLHLEALLMLKHLQKPSIIHNLTVKEWVERKFSRFQNQKVAIISSDETIIVLEEEEELLFNIYYKFIRPTQLVKDAHTVDCFFVTSKGQPIKNASKDLSRFHEK
ncbi:uncharacterized protein LOC143767887 [Ranitomeya variabilis]|uniref:uncharacterized protein LOC143767887 n=1 Tax=Ranitomeya variabilis TaxID=490064 RepID=UPI004056E561